MADFVHKHHPRHYKAGSHNYLTQEEVMLFFKEIKNPRDIAIFALMYFYGLRATELCNLKLTDIDLKKTMIYINALKHGISGHYHLTSVAISKINPYLQIRDLLDVDSPYIFITKQKTQMTRHQLAKLTLKYGLLAEIDRSKLFSHVFRHAIAVHMASSNADIGTVKMHLRHKSIHSTIHYFDIMNEAKLKLQAIALQGEYVAKI
jgi:type 1 fimbriae regulatory protein FimB